MSVRTSVKPVLQSADNTNMSRLCGNVPRPAPAVLRRAGRLPKLGPFEKLHRTGIWNALNEEKNCLQASFQRDTLKAIRSIRNHWPEYLMEAGGLAVYMFSTCLFATLLQYRASPVRHAIQADLSRRALMGLAIGTTVGAMILSPWGQQSGGHFNPALTLAFFRLGTMRRFGNPI